jgi:hypothetical protein
MLAFVISFFVGFAVVTLYTVYKDFKEENKRVEQEIVNEKQKKDLNEIVDKGLQNLFQPLIDKAIEEILIEAVKGKDYYELDLRSIIKPNDKSKYMIFKRMLLKALEDEYDNSFSVYARWEYTMMYIEWR